MKFEVFNADGAEIIETKDDIMIKGKDGRTAFIVGMREDGLMIGTYTQPLRIKPNSGNSITVISGEA